MNIKLNTVTLHRGNFHGDTKYNATNNEQIYYLLINSEMHRFKFSDGTLQTHDITSWGVSQFCAAAPGSSRTLNSSWGIQWREVCSFFLNTLSSVTQCLLASSPKNHHEVSSFFRSLQSSNWSRGSSSLLESRKLITVFALEQFNPASWDAIEYYFHLSDPRYLFSLHHLSLMFWISHLSDMCCTSYPSYSPCFGIW